jgi:hypothetical protein
MDSPNASPPIPTAASTPTVDLKSPLSSLEIAIGPGTNFLASIGAVIGLMVLAAILYASLYWWRAYVNSKYEPFSSLKRCVLTLTCRYARVANAEQQPPANPSPGPSSNPD